MFAINHKTETLLLVIICILAGSFLAIYSKNRPNSNLSTNIPIVQTRNVEESPLFVIPTPTEIPEISTTNEISSDGTKKLNLTKETNPDKSHIYTLTSQDGTGENTRIIFTKNLPADSDISIPYNTWSPDNKYFFIKENSPVKTDIKVYTAQGEPFVKDELFLDLTETFNLRNTGFNYQEATGWGGYSLIVFNTKNQSEEQGPSFWFEVPSKAVIQLSTLFL